MLTLARLARVLERACSDLPGARLTLAQYRLLATMADGAERASHLAGQLALSKPTVSATVDTLVERGLVARETVDGDRRATRLTLTAPGHAALLLAEAPMRERLDDLLGRVDDPAAVLRSIAQLRAALDERRARNVAPPGRARDRAGTPRVDPPPVAVPGPPPAQGVHRVRRVAGHDARHGADPADRAGRRRQRDRRATPGALAAARPVGRVGSGELLALLRAALRGWSLRVRRAARHAHRDLRAAPTPRLRPPRPAPDGPDRVACELRPRARAGAAELPAPRDRQRRPVVPVPRGDARALTAVDGDRAGDGARAALRVAEAAPDDVPRAMGLAAARRRGRGRGRRSRQRRAGREGLRPGGPGAGRPHRRSAGALPLPGAHGTAPGALRVGAAGDPRTRAGRRARARRVARDPG